MLQPSGAVDVLYRDTVLVAVDKPAGLLAVPGRGEAGREHLVGRVAAAIGAPVYVVHRLDQATSGVMLLALDPTALRRLHRAFAEREVDKRYVAVVDGWVADDVGCIDLPLAADWERRPRQRVAPLDGKPACTHYTVDARWPAGARGAPCATTPSRAHEPPARRTRLHLTPVTGRSHQLRVHLAAIGHPIVGDALYADAAVAAAAPRLLLHAASLSLAHPVDGRPLNFSSTAPF